MTVQELINELEKIEDKTMEVILYDELLKLSTSHIVEVSKNQSHVVLS